MAAGGGHIVVVVVVLMVAFTKVPLSKSPPNVDDVKDVSFSDESYALSTRKPGCVFRQNTMTDVQMKKTEMVAQIWRGN